LGNFPEFAVEVLGSTPQDVERLVCANAFALHQDTFGLSNEFSRAEGSVEIVGSALFVFMEMSGRVGPPKHKDIDAQQVVDLRRMSTNARYGSDHHDLASSGPQRCGRSRPEHGSAK
jgi:hypothetical protein